MPAPFEIQVLSIDPVSWTPVTVAFDRNSLPVKNADPANAVKFRRNVANAATEDTLPSLSLPRRYTAIVAAGNGGNGTGVKFLA